MSPIVDRAVFQELSRLAREVAAAHSGSPEVESKSIGLFDPVTDVDRNIESALHQFISCRFRSDGIVGEELGGQRPEASRRWSIDPIDGTRSYLCGLPTWSILVGVVEEGRHVASMIDVPSMSELFIAVDNKTLRNGVAVRTSGITKLAEARLSTTDPYLFVGAEAAAFQRMRNASMLTRYGLDGFAYARLAAGDLDLVMESGLKTHDYDALIPVVRGAGGHIGDWDGGEDFATGRILAAATRRLYDEAVALIGLGS